MGHETSKDVWMVNPSRWAGIEPAQGDLPGQGGAENEFTVRSVRLKV